MKGIYMSKTTQQRFTPTPQKKILLPLLGQKRLIPAVTPIHPKVRPSQAVA